MGDRRDGREERRGGGGDREKRQGGGNRGEHRGGPHQGRHQNRDVMVPYELEEENEFFEITSSGAKYDFITDLKDKLHSNWLHVLLCSVLISSTGLSHTLDTVYNACLARGLNEEAVSKDALAEFLRSDYYHKHEVFNDPKIETCRFSLNHQAARPASFLNDLSTHPPFSPLPDEKLKEDGALFILSMARGIMSRDNHNDVSTGDVIFKDMQRLIRDYLAIELNMPGKAIKPLNLRTHIIHFVPNADGTALEKKVTDGVSVSKIEGGQDKTVKYRFLPKIAPRW